MEPQKNPDMYDNQTQEPLWAGAMPQDDLSALDIPKRECIRLQAQKKHMWLHLSFLPPPKCCALACIVLSHVY